MGHYIACFSSETTQECFTENTKVKLLLSLVNRNVMALLVMATLTQVASQSDSEEKHPYMQLWKCCSVVALTYLTRSEAHSLGRTWYRTLAHTLAKITAHTFIYIHTHTHTHTLVKLTSTSFSLKLVIFLVDGQKGTHIEQMNEYWGDHSGEVRFEKKYWHLFSTPQMPLLVVDSWFNI